MYREQEKSYFSGRKWANLCELHKFLFVLCLENYLSLYITSYILLCIVKLSHICRWIDVLLYLLQGGFKKKSHFAQPIEQLISGSVILFNQERII